MTQTTSTAALTVVDVRTAKKPEDLPQSLALEIGEVAANRTPSWRDLSAWFVAPPLLMVALFGSIVWSMG
jgi:hypothetical protein